MFSRCWPGEGVATPVGIFAQRAQAQLHEQDDRSELPIRRSTGDHTKRRQRHSRHGSLFPRPGFLGREWRKQRGLNSSFPFDDWVQTGARLLMAIDSATPPICTSAKGSKLLMPRRVHLSMTDLCRVCPARFRKQKNCYNTSNS